MILYLGHTIFIPVSNAHALISPHSANVISIRLPIVFSRPYLVSLNCKETLNFKDWFTYFFSEPFDFLMAVNGVNVYIAGGLKIKVI